MIAVVCRSGIVAAEFQRLSGAVICPDAVDGVDPGPWLRRFLSENAVRAVFYDPAVFVDPAPFRTKSPSTSFFVIAGFDDDENATQAMIHGAVGIVAKPLDPRDVRGALSLVDR